MPTWGGVLEELAKPANALGNGAPDFDKVRRGYLAALHAYTNRAVILYASSFLDHTPPNPASSVDLGDKQGFMNAIAGITDDDLDLIVTSQGGSAEATESILTYLRTRFSTIRVFVPVAAMSAATMLALGADEIVLGKHSQLGPIDPQFFIQTPEGIRSAPAAEILAQFETAKRECQDPKNLNAWAPILRTYTPGLLAQCVTQQELAETMVSKWLEKYMFSGQPDAAARAQALAKWFGDYKSFGSHGRSVTLPQLAATNLGLKLTPLEADQTLQDLVLSVHHATSHTFSKTRAFKIIENHLGKAFVRMEALVQLGKAVPLQPPSSAKLVQQPALNRAARRKQGLRN